MISMLSCQSAEDLYNAGLAYYKGSNGKEQNTDKAINLLQRAAKKGFNEANYPLGEIALKTGDLQGGLEWFDKYIDGGNYSAAMKLGKAFDSGEGIFPENDSYAVKYYKKAIELDMADAEVFNNLGVMYYNGNGTSLDYGKAFDCFKRAADMNDSQGLFNLSACYLNGMGVEKNQEVALDYMRKAADLGHSGAQEYLEEVRLQEERARARQREAYDNEYVMCPICKGTGRNCSSCGYSGYVTRKRAKRLIEFLHIFDVF